MTIKVRLPLNNLRKLRLKVLDFLGVISGSKIVKIFYGDGCPNDKDMVWIHQNLYYDSENFYSPYKKEDGVAIFFVGAKPSKKIEAAVPQDEIAVDPEVLEVKALKDGVIEKLESKKRGKETEMTSRTLFIEDCEKYHSMMDFTEKISSYDEFLKLEHRLGDFNFVVTDLFMEGPDSAKEPLEQLLRQTNPICTRWGEWTEENLQDAFRGNELPMGLLIAQKCIELDIPVIVATDGDHHGGKAYLPIGCAAKLLDTGWDGHPTEKGAIVDCGPNAKDDPGFWERVKDRIRSVEDLRSEA